jgi:predicted phosphodiesterase
MTTAVVSDLHLGTRSHQYVLNDPAARETLAKAVSGADRLVLLGDSLELRESPLADAIDAALPTFELLGQAMEGREVVLVAGNHDHQLAAPLLDDLRAKDSLASLGLERTMKAPARGAVGRIRKALGKAALSLAYPGVWVRDDVYATHGHYLDCHNTVPTLECLSIAATIRAIGGLPAGRRTPADYEKAVSPTYALTYTVAQAPGPAARLIAGRTSLEMWKRLNGARSGRSRLAARALSRVVFPGAVAAINRAGLGPFGTDLSGDSLRRAGLRGMAATIESLGIEADHVIFGHTHRSGPHPGDEGWDLPDGTRLINSGSWIYEPAFLGSEPKQSPYWPGNCVWVEDSGAPELRRLIT